MSKQYFFFILGSSIVKILLGGGGIAICVAVIKTCTYQDFARIRQC